MFGDLCEAWPVTWCGDLAAAGVSPAVTGEAVLFASAILWEATGRRFGNCPVTLRGCRDDCQQFPGWLPWWDPVSSASTWGWPYPTLIDGLWFNLACGACGGLCSCNSYSSITLPEPVADVLAVSIDGVELVPGVDYVVYDNQTFVKTEGEWPRCQDWHVTGGPGTFLIQASFGGPIPPGGPMAVGVLAFEIAKMCSGQDCDLPQRVTSVSRQGVTVTVQDPKEFLDNGLTGLYIPDRWIRTYNPSGIQDRARAYSPDDFLPRLQ